MYEKFEDLCKPGPLDEVLDLGTTPDETLKDSNYFEKFYPWKNRITICSIENCSNIAKKYGLKGFVQNSPKKRLPFKDKEFDILFCSAVLEHVGSRKNQRFFLEECLRVSNKIFLTTPNRWFPLEMHSGIPFIHWLPRRWFEKLVFPIREGFWSNINNLNLLDEKDIYRLSKKVRVQYIKTFGIKSNIIIIKR